MARRLMTGRSVAGGMAVAVIAAAAAFGDFSLSGQTRITRITPITQTPIARITPIAQAPISRTTRNGDPAALVRGNAPGEWRYWGGDAWSTRYSPLEQIDASNFAKLAIKWQWNASAFGADEYYRTTPLYANGRLFTVASTRRAAAAIDPENGQTLWKWRDGRGHSLAEGAAAIRGARAGVLDRRQVRARDRHDARLSHGVARRGDRPSRSEVRQGRHRRSDGRPRVSARPARGGRSGTARDQRRGAGAQSETGRDVEQGNPHGRRRHRRDRSRARPDRRSVVPRSSSTT